MDLLVAKYHSERECCKKSDKSDDSPKNILLH